MSAYKLAEEAEDQANQELALVSVNEAPKADKAAADADKKKAETLKAISRKSLNGLLGKSKELDEHVKEQFKLLEKLLGEQKFEVKFDEKNKGDVEWLEK